CSRFSRGRSRLLFMELWDLLHIETIVYSQQQRDQLKGSVKVCFVDVGKLDHVCFVHVDASVLAYPHCLLPICMMVSKLDRHIDGIEPIVTRETFRYFFKRVGE